MLYIVNGIIVLEDKVLENTHVLVINKDVIQDIIQRDELIIEVNDKVIDAEGCLVTPGFIDIHSDYIENVVSPRPTAMMSFNTSLMETEKVLISCGITTMFHSLALFKVSNVLKRPIRDPRNAYRLIDEITNYKNSLINNLIHLRLEIDQVDVVDLVKDVIADNKIDLLSFMDHTPGQGQYKDMDVYVKSVFTDKNTDEEEINKRINEHQVKPKLSNQQLVLLAEYARGYNVPLASHDDDSIEKLDFAQSLGVRISEFPITLEVAQEAHKRGLYTIVGAPNILLNGSHSGNLSAIEGIRAGVVDIICSDYYPFAMVNALFILNEKTELTIFEIVKMLTINPARAVGIDDNYGSISIGKKADILLIGYEKNNQEVKKAIVSGNEVYSVTRRNNDI